MYSPWVAPMPHTEETGSYHTHIHHCPMHSGAKYINHNLAACSVITIAQRQILIIAYILYFGRTIDGVFASVCVCFFLFAYRWVQSHTEFRHARTHTRGSAAAYESRSHLSPSTFPCHSIASCPLMHAFYVRCQKVGCQLPFRLVKEV